jgi:porin
MNRTTTYLLCACILLLASSQPGWTAPPGQQNPSAPQPQSPGAAQAQSTASTPQTGLPDLPTTGNGAVPAGLDNPMTSIWDWDQLTGDWGGFRDEMHNHGVAFNPTLTAEVFGNPSGGMRHGVTTDGLVNLPLDLDLDRMSDGAVEDLTIHANAEYLYGAALSEYFVGDFSNTSNIAGYNTLRLQELWMQKMFWEKRLSLKVGNMAVDTEFFQSASASLFINGTFGAFTFIANNVPNAPVYPVASPGVRLQFLPTSRFYVMAGVYGQDVNSDPTTNNQNGTRFALTSSSGMLIMSEAGFLLNQSPNDRGLQGIYRLGSFVHTDDSPRFADGSNGGTSYGVYGVLDQQIYSNANQAISFFVRSGGAPGNTNFVDYYVDSGFNFTGFIPGRDNDVAGIGVARSHVSDDFSDSQVALGNPPSTAETVIEATYKAQIAPWWSIQPDLQYIVTPSGVKGSRNAVVVGLRTNVAF